MTPIQEIYICRDVLVKWLDDAIAASEAVDQWGDLAATRMVASKRWGKVDDMMGSLCRRVAARAQMDPTAACTPEGLQVEYEQASDRGLPNDYTTYARVAE